MFDKKHESLSMLDKIFTENEIILLKTLTAADQHDYTSVLLPVRFIQQKLHFIFKNFL